MKKQGKRSKKKHLSKEAFRKIRYKQNMWRVYKHTGKDTDYDAYKEALNAATNEVRKSKRNFEHKLAQNIKSDSKSFYAYVRSKQNVRDKVGPLKDNAGNIILDLLDLKLLLVIQRRGHTTKNSTPGDAMIGDTSCLSDGKVDDCEVLRYAVQPPSSWTASWSRPADCVRGEVMQFQHFTFGWHTLQVTEPAQSALRQGD